jgi:hypothetical protein
MIDVVELRSGANTLRQWANDIRRESVPHPKQPPVKTSACWKRSPTYWTAPGMKFYDLDRPHHQNDSIVGARIASRPLREMRYDRTSEASTRY